MLRVRSKRQDHTEEAAEKLLPSNFLISHFMLIFTFKTKEKEVLKHQNIPAFITLGLKFWDLSVLKWLRMSHMSRDLSIL